MQSLLYGEVRRARKNKTRENKINDSVPRGTLFCLTYATDFAGKEGLLVISDFPVHHFKMPIKTASCAGQRIYGNSNLSISASEAFDSQSRVKPSPAVSDSPSEYAFCLTKYRKS